MNVYKISKIVVIIIGIIASILFVSALGMEISMENNSYIVDYFIYVSYLAMAIAFFSVVYCCHCCTGCTAGHGHAHKNKPYAGW